MWKTRTDALANALGHNRPDGLRSPAAKKRRRAALKAKLKARKAAAKALPPREGATDEQALRERVLQAQLAAKDKLLRLERRRLKRDLRTAVQRVRQMERRAPKQQARHLQAKQARGVAQAARKEKQRGRKRTLPAGEPLHSGERRHRQRLAQHAARAQ